MTGEVRSVDSRGCRGWARLPEQPGYGVVVHLIVDKYIRASAIADDKCDDEHDPAFEQDGWFTLDVPEDVADRRGEFRVLVGESGEYLHDPALANPYGIDKTSKANGFGAVPPRSRPVATYRDGMACGLSVADILGLLYLDILRRPIDNGALAINMAALLDGRISFETMREGLLRSAEYGRLRLKQGDACGRIFANSLAIRSSSRRQNFERYAETFQRSNAPISDRLLRFFPGLLLRPLLLERVEAAARNGLPAREVFCRAISYLSDRPALILPDLPHAPSSIDATASLGREPEIVVPLSSTHLALGWHKVEGAEESEFRWMSQIGIILNPAPLRAIERIDITVNGWYEKLSQIMAVASDRGRLALARRQLEDGSWLLSITAGETAETFDYVVLVAAEATCPCRYDGTPDPRVLSFSIARVAFVYREEAA